MNTKHTNDTLKTRGRYKGGDKQPPSLTQPKKQSKSIIINPGDTIVFNYSFTISTSQKIKYNEKELKEYLINQTRIYLKSKSQ